MELAAVQWFSQTLRVQIPTSFLEAANVVAASTARVLLRELYDRTPTHDMETSDASQPAL